MLKRKGIYIVAYILLLCFATLFVSGCGILNRLWGKDEASALYSTNLNGHDDLQVAAQGMQSILRQHGYTNAKVVSQVDDNQYYLRVSAKSAELEGIIKLIDESVALEFRNSNNDEVIFAGYDPDTGVRHLLSAEAVTGGGDSWSVQINISSYAQQRFADATAALVGQIIDIYVGDTIISSPKITEAINSPTFNITGSFSKSLANELATKMLLGALGLKLTLKQVWYPPDK